MAFVYEAERWKQQVQDNSNVPLQHAAKEESHLKDPTVFLKKNKAVQNKVPFLNSAKRFQPIEKEKIVYEKPKNRLFDEFGQAMDDLNELKKNNSLVNSADDVTQGSETGELEDFTNQVGRDQINNGPFKVKKDVTPGPGHYFPSDTPTLKTVSYTHLTLPTIYSV